MLLFTFLFSLFTSNQSIKSADSLWIIQQINITGNQKTHENIIQRELDLVLGDSIKKEDLAKRIDLNKRKLVNTNLFITVEINYTHTNKNQIVISVKLLEQWYILGYPIFQIADRNYAEWFQRGADFKRTTFGIDLIHSNFRGRAERLNLRLETGFTQRIDLGYRIPYIDKAMKTGAGFSLSYITNKTLAFRSLNDTLNYIRNLDEILRRRFSGAIYLKKRYHFYDNHTLELRYNSNTISDTIRKLNPDYFLDNWASQKYFQLSYSFNYDFRDNVAYPLRGKRYELLISKLGILPNDNIDQLEITGGASWYKPLGKKLFYGLNLRGKISFPERQPFYNVRGLGYLSDLVRGYELYVIDGSNFLLARNTLRYQLINGKINLKFLKIKQFNQVPIGIYPSIFADYGYVQNRFTEINQSKLSNRSLFGSGIGLDLVTYYNLVVRFSYVVNDRKEKNVVFSIGREF